VSYPSWDMIRNGTFVRTRNFPLLEVDTPTFMGQPHAVTPKDLEGADVVIIGAPYVASWQEYAGVAKSEWIAGPKRVRQQSIRYQSGYVQDFDLDVFEHLRVRRFR
jgi:agmatinase